MHGGQEKYVCVLHREMDGCQFMNGRGELVWNEGEGRAARALTPAQGP